jgi:hypothetical protein
LKRVIPILGAAVFCLALPWLVGHSKPMPHAAGSAAEVLGHTRNAHESAKGMGELLNNTESFDVLDEATLMWLSDQPSHMVIDRIHGGITPGQGGLPVE